MSSMIAAACASVIAEETLAPLVDGKAPQTLEETWAGFDPRQEPLDVEILKEWEHDGVILKVLRYRIGVFKGQKAMMAAVYGYPKDADVRCQVSGQSSENEPGTKNEEPRTGKVPGLVQIHGGGQYAHWNACFTNAKRGYATISISWAGRISAPDYMVNPEVVKLFWDGKTDDPNYRLTTDWGALDGYHAPSRYLNGFSNLAPHEHTLDAVDSPRNDSWFLCALGARRALTFLEQQPEVDGGRLGVYGHSMGGKLTVMVAGADDRVKAAAPSCGGISHRDKKNSLLAATISDDAYLKRVGCPIFFLSPANDFHGRIDDLPTALKEIKSSEWRVTCAPQHNHQDTDEYEVATQLWFDQVLKGTFTVPRTPETSLNLTAERGAPVLTIKPDTSRKILAVDVFYTQQADQAAADRFWHHAVPVMTGDAWSAPAPILSLDKPLWIYANVLYALDEPVTGAGYYYGTYTTSDFTVSSEVAMVTPEQLKAAGVKATLKPSLVIEDFQGDWEKEWYVYSNDPGRWDRNTHKVYDDRYQAPPFSKLAFEVKADAGNKLVVVLDNFAAEMDIGGGDDWQEVVLYPMDFSNAQGGVRLDWQDLKNLRLINKEVLRPKDGEPVHFGGEWRGGAPEFRNLRWLPGTREELNARRQVKLLDAESIDGKTYLDIQSAESFTHGYKVVMNAWLDDASPLVIDGKTYEHGLTTHAHSEAIYFLGGKFNHFHAMPQAWQNATVTFQVYVDDRKVFDSGQLVRWQSKTVDLPLDGAQELKLVVADGGNGKGGDHASWVDAYVVPAGAVE